MKVDITPTGTLRITAETAIEGFALTHWHTLWQARDTGVSLLVGTMQHIEGSTALHPEFAVVDPVPQLPEGKS